MPCRAAPLDRKGELEWHKAQHRDASLVAEHGTPNVFTAWEDTDTSDLMTSFIWESVPVAIAAICNIGHEPGFQQKVPLENRGHTEPWEMKGMCASRPLSPLDSQPHGASRTGHTFRWAECCSAIVQAQQVLLQIE